MLRWHPHIHAGACIHARAHNQASDTRIYLFSSWHRELGVRRARVMTRLCLFYLKARFVSFPSLPKKNLVWNHSVAEFFFRQRVCVWFFFSFFFLFFLRCARRHASSDCGVRADMQIRRGRAAPGVDNDACIDAVSPAAHRFPFV